MRIKTSVNDFFNNFIKLPNKNFPKSMVGMKHSSSFCISLYKQPNPPARWATTVTLENQWLLHHVPSHPLPFLLNIKIFIKQLNKVNNLLAKPYRQGEGETSYYNTKHSYGQKQTWPAYGPNCWLLSSPKGNYKQ